MIENEKDSRVRPTPPAPLPQRPAPDVHNTPTARTCDACGYEVIEFRPLPRCPMCGALPGAVWTHGALVAASAA